MGDSCSSSTSSPKVTFLLLEPLFSFLYQIPWGLNDRVFCRFFVPCILLGERFFFFHTALPRCSHTRSARGPSKGFYIAKREALNPRLWKSHSDAWVRGDEGTVLVPASGEVNRSMSKSGTNDSEQGSPSRNSSEIYVVSFKMGISPVTVFKNALRPTLYIKHVQDQYIANFRNHPLRKELITIWIL